MKFFNKCSELLITTALLALASPAYAANTAIIMWNGAAVDTATGTGSVDLVTSSLGGVTILTSTGTRVTSPNGLGEANINIDNTTKSVETLNIILGANGYLGKAAEFKLSGTVITTGGSADLAGSYFVDGTDTLNGTTKSVTGVDIRDFNSGLLSGPDSFSFNGFGTDNVAGPYALAERLTLTLQPGAAVGVQGVAMIAVPEPRTWALMGVGFALMGMMGLARGRRPRARYAI